MNSIYRPIDSAIPENLTKPTSNYRKHVWLAMGGIVLFVLFYLSLTIWFFYSAYRLFANAVSGGENSFIGILIGGAAAFLGVFMIKGLFFIKRSLDLNSKQITPEEEPLLFDYLNKLADEAGAPRPHKVFLSNQVNASVFYDLSILDLFFPSKKNLDIGLGLINVLNLGEFKAVLAHEFGHFAQKSMLVGRWVYIANQVANAIIYQRDALDRLLNGLSSFDLRVAWVGWILSIIVWSIRSLVETIFQIVVLSQRALSREMEFQADLVAVSLTGSDALIHALHKLQAADQAFSSAIQRVNEELNDKKAVEDVYALQTNAIQKTAWLLNDPEFGSSPKIPEKDAANYRVFQSKIAQPPKMWATHPPDNEREENAKRVYINAAIDQQSAWALFSNPDKTKKDLTKFLIDSAKVKTTILPTEESVSNQNKIYDRTYFNPVYKGVYLNRFFYQEYQNPEDIYLETQTIADADQSIKELYPESLVADLEDFTSIKEEYELLEAVHKNQMTTSGNGIWFRGTQIRKKELPQVLEKVSKEVKVAKAKITEHDRLCRTTYRNLALKIGRGWHAYLKGLVGCIHYCEHSIANLNDAHKVLINVYQVITADGRISSGELRKLIIACNEVYSVLQNIHTESNNVILDQQLLKELNIANWQEKLGKFDLPYATENNINDWINSIDSWVTAYVNDLSSLRSESLEVLLKTEEQVQKMAQSNVVESALPPTKLPEEYNVLLPGDERPIQTKLSLWDRFISADGLVPSIVRFAVAATIVGATIFMVTTFGKSEVYIYNGLSETIEVSLDGRRVFIKPGVPLNFEIDPESDFTITTKTENGETIESFQPEFNLHSSKYVYNVAGAASLIEWTMYYGYLNPEGGETILGNKRWSTTKVEYVFRDPPESIRTSSDRETRDALAAFGYESPGYAMSMIDDSVSLKNLILTHARWDGAQSKGITSWFANASQYDEFQEILQQRLERNPDEVVSIRAIQDYGSEKQKSDACSKYSSASKDQPDRADFLYLATRCVEDEALKNKAFINGAEKFPENGWLAFAAGYAYTEQFEWEKGFQFMKTAYQKEPTLQDHISMDLERVRRVISAKEATVFGQTTEGSPYLEYYENLASGIDPELRNSPSHAYYHIEQGELEEAMQRVQDEPEYRNSVLCLAAGSDGAKEEWIDEVLSTKIEELVNNNNIWVVLGLYVKKNKNTSELKSFLSQMDDETAESTFRFIDLIKSGNYQAAEKIPQEFTLWTRGELFAMACVILGDRAPGEWRLYAKNLLFITERPYFE